MCVPSGRDRSSGVPCAARLHPDCATAVSVGSVQSATSPCYTEIRQFAPLRAGRWRCAVLLWEPRLCGYHGAHCPDQTAQRDTHAVRPRPRVVPCGVPCRAACGGPLRGASGALCILRGTHASAGPPRNLLDRRGLQPGACGTRRVRALPLPAVRRVVLRGVGWGGVFKIAFPLRFRLSGWRNALRPLSSM